MYGMVCKAMQNSVWECLNCGRRTGPAVGERIGAGASGDPKREQLVQTARAC
jgi:hypothetical protein